MFEATFDTLEALIPSGRADVPVVPLRELLEGLSDPSDETRIGIKILKQFETASRIQLPAEDGIRLWLGYCVGGFHEVPRREEFFLFAVSRRGNTVEGFATGIEGDELPKLLSQSAVEQISADQVQSVLDIVRSKPVDLKRSDWFSAIEHTDGSSLGVSPRISARYFLRQGDGKLLFVQPSRCGGWYGELWPRVV